MRDSDIALAHRLADASGDVIRPLFRSGTPIIDKDDASPVTAADRGAEAAIRRLIEAECPRDGIIGEEYGEKPGTTGRVWVLDPIDGTTSFISGRPIFGTLIALMEEGWPVLGVIDQPVARERWIGAAGRPTLFNGSAAKTRACSQLSNAILATTSPHQFDAAQGEQFLKLAAEVARRRIVYGGDCYSYGLVASGHVDVVVEAGLKLHDFAALIPVVEGAGGLMCDWAGDPLSAGNTAGQVIALGDPARLEDVLEALASS